RRMGHPLVQRAADVPRFPPVGDRIPHQGELSSFRFCVDPLDDSTVEIRHPDARGLEGVSAARVREYRVGGVFYCQEMDLMSLRSAAPWRRFGSEKAAASRRTPKALRA